MQAEQPWAPNEWMVNDWPRNGWGLTSYVWGIQTQIYGEENMPVARTKGSYKGWKSPGAWPNLIVCPGGKAYAKSDWATKTNERSIAKQMPSSGEFSRYSVWAEEAKR